jgi:hypothetical protein
VSYYVIEIRGHAAIDDTDGVLAKLQAAHTDMVKDLADGVEPNAQGSFGVDQVEGSYSTVVTGQATGDHLESVKAAFEKGKAAIIGIDPEADAKFTFVDDEGKTTTQDTE